MSTNLFFLQWEGDTDGSRWGLPWGRFKNAVHAGLTWIAEWHSGCDCEGGWVQSFLRKDTPNYTITYAVGPMVYNRAWAAGGKMYPPCNRLSPQFHTAHGIKSLDNIRWCFSCVNSQIASKSQQWVTFIFNGKSYIHNKGKTKLFILAEL